MNWFVIWFSGSDSEIQQAIRINLSSAVRTALLMLPETFSEEELYLCITGLSYSGEDFVGRTQIYVLNHIELGTCQG